MRYICGMYDVRGLWRMGGRDWWEMGMVWWGIGCCLEFVGSSVDVDLKLRAR